MSNSNEYVKYAYELVDLRHYFHQHPELSNKEVKTTAKIKKLLAKWDVPVLPTKLDTGLLAELKGPNPGPIVALRADLDALPVQEEVDSSFKSVNDGVMHACGHDLHITSLLGAIRYFKDHQSEINGTLRFLFQPAEEAGGGADQVLAKNVLHGVQAAISFHNNPNLPIGTIALEPGPMMAGCYKFEIDIHGQGSHGAKPEKSHDPIITLAAIIENLQTIVSRNVDPQDAVVVSVTHVNGGHSWNVIPDQAHLQGTVRVFDLKQAELVKQRLFKLVNGLTSAYDQTASIDWSERALPIHNDEQLTKAVINQLTTPVEQPTLSMGGEDFATYQKQVPGVFAFIGSNGSVDAADWHEPNFVGLDETLPTGIKYFVEGTEGILKSLTNANQNTKS